MGQRKNPKTHPKKVETSDISMQHYRHYGCSSSSSPSSASVEEVHAEEEVFEVEEKLQVEEGVQPVLQETEGVGKEKVPQKKKDLMPAVTEAGGKEARTPSVESKNGKRTEGGGDAGGGPKYSIFTWFVVLALLGVWSSVAVVYFDIVDYDSVIARAKEFRMNFSEVLQGKLTAYDTDGDGDFDVEDAKVLLGLTKDGGGNANAESLEEVLNILAEEGSDWIYGFFTFLYDIVSSPVERGEEEGKEVAAERQEESDTTSSDEEDEKKLKGSAFRRDRLRKEDKMLEANDRGRKLSEEKSGEAAARKNPTQGLKGAERPPVEVSPDKNTETSERVAETRSQQAAEPAEATSPNVPTEPVASEGEPTLHNDQVSGSQDVESEIQAAVPLPPLVDDNFVPDDPQDSRASYENEVHTIDTTGVLVEEPPPTDSVAGESEQYLTSSKLTREEEPVVEGDNQTEMPAEPEAQSETPKETDSGSEAQGTADKQPEEKLKEKGKKKKPKLLNKFDKTIKAEIDAAEKLRKKGKVEEALKAFELLVQQYPQSPRARYGKAQAEDDLADKLRSNDMLQKAISSYREAAELPDVTSDLLRAALKRRAERQQFLGRMRGSLMTLEKLVQIFPEDISLKNDLGVAHLLLGDNKGAKKVYEEVLAVSPNDGFAKVHYGFILKSENKIAESIPYLKEGLESGEPGTDDGRFYFHLGDALQRVGDNSQAYYWYELGHKHGHFASVWQRSLYNVDGLKAQPWWTPKETGYTDLVKTLERNWKTIRDEALAVMDQNTGLFIPEEENLREKGEWGQYTLWQQGRKVGNSCQGVPKTCSLLERYTEATGCKRGQIKFSVMQPGTHVWPHTGPTNCRLRMHLGLVIPKRGCRIRCTNQTREWEEGKVLIFDDSFEHEVWQEADSYRLIFIVDVWHPELTQYQRQTLSPI